jgi:hypothetical protein
MFYLFRNATIGAATLALTAGLSPSAQSAYMLTLLQQGPDVVASGSGSFDLTDLTLAVGISSRALIAPASGSMWTGPVGATDGDVYGDATGPGAFGGGSLTFADSGSGDLAGIFSGGGIVVPAGYVSGSLSGTATYSNQTFASLGLAPGTYVWTWGAGADADSLTLRIGPAAAAPEPASMMLLAAALAGLGAVLRTRGA